jgi:hypothetical protein
MTHGNDSEVDRHRVDAFASEDELTIETLLQAAPTAPARPREPRRSASSLYQRIGHAGGLLWLVNTLYLRVLADPLLMSYFKHLDDPDRQWLRWHMLTLLAVVTGGPSKYQPGSPRSPRRSPHHRGGVRPSGLASAGNAPGAGGPAGRPAGHPRRGAGTAGCGRDLREVFLDGSVASGSRRHLSVLRPGGQGCLMGSHELRWEATAEPPAGEHSEAWEPGALGGDRAPAGVEEGGRLVGCRASEHCH